MTVSKIASKIYQAAKAVCKGVWEWRSEWSKAMKQAWRKVMENEWKFEAKQNGMIFCWGPMIDGRCVLDIATIDSGVIYTKKGLGADLTDGRTVILGLKIADKHGLSEAIEQAKINERNAQPQCDARALYNWIQNEGYDLDGNSIPCPA